MSTHFKNMGVGVGLRPSHYQTFQETRPQSIDWIEVISENYMPWSGQKKFGHAFDNLLSIRKNLPISLHGVSMNLGSTDSLDLDYMNRLKLLVDAVDPFIVSDHLSWTGVNQINMHDLLPMPYTQESLNLFVEKIDQVQSFLKRQIAIENPSSYFEFKSSEYEESHFISQVIQKTGSAILLDINNVYVSSINHGFDPKKYLLEIPSNCVVQIHLAGHSKRDGFLIDTHDAPICEEVWNLYKWYAERNGIKSVMIERDGNIPEWKEMEIEIRKIREINCEIQKSTINTKHFAENHY